MPAKESTWSSDSSETAWAGMPACAISCRCPLVRLPNHSRYSLFANSISSLPRGATEIDASSASSTVVKRSNEEESCSRMRLGSVMSVIEVIQPVWVPRASISGETYRRASNRELSGRLTRICTPPGVNLPASSSLSIWVSVSWSVSGQYGNGAVRPTSSDSLQPVI